MIPSITIFKEALESPADHFRTLCAAVPVRQNGDIAVSRTAFFAEAMVRFDSRSWLACMPLTRSAVIAVERMAGKLQYVKSDYLCEYRILYREMHFEDELGREQECDIVLQEYPEGELLSRTTSYGNAQLRAMLNRLHEHLAGVGFTHNNLKPSNIIVGDDGRMHPVRYHYAELGEGCNDYFAPLYALIADDDSQKLNDIFASYSAECGKTVGGGILRFSPHEGLVRIVENNRYGYADEQMRTVIAPQYVWADDFGEGRAVVETEHGMGLIDKQGREIIPAEFGDLRYDTYSGESVGNKNGERYVFGYDGHLIDKS